MVRNLIITGGIYHPFEEASEALASALGDVGISSEITLDVDGGIAALGNGTIDMITVYALRWGMSQDEKYEPFRDEWVYTTPHGTRDTLTDFVKGGGGLLGLHTASICFDDWPEWGRLLGGAWQWGTSFHPPPAPMEIELVQGVHPVIADLGNFEVTDEHYQGMALEPDIEPLAFCRPGGGDRQVDEAQPLVWARCFGEGRVVYDSLGHDAASVSEPTHKKLLQQAALWVSGKIDQSRK